jgi:hypothetical protein
MQPTFTIPATDLADFAMLPTAERERIGKLLTALGVIHKSQNKSLSARTIAHLNREQRGFSACSLLAAYRSYSATGAWRVLVRRYHLPRPRTIRTEGATARMTRHLAHVIRRAS